MLAVAVAGCTSGTEDPAPAESDTAAAVLQSRSALGEPMVALAEAVIVLADDLDAARYEAGRGPGMRAALEDIGARVDAVRDAADAADDAAADAAIEAAGGIVSDAATRARAAADAADEEVVFLRAVARIDRRLLDLADLWDEPGSQSEIRSRLDAAAGRVARLRRQARALDPVPDGCKVMKRNRVTWAATVRTRTLRLQDQANSAGGGEFDDLRAAYRRLPFGVEPRTADQQERPCWRASSPVWTATDELRAAVDALEAALE